MTPTTAADIPLAELVLERPPTLASDASVACAMRSMLESGCDYVLTDLDGDPAVPTRADVDRVLPSPATSLASYEVPERLERVTLRHALRGTAPVLSPTATVVEAVQTLRASGWAPVVVKNGEALLGIVTAETVAEQLLGPPQRD